MGCDYLSLSLIPASGTIPFALCRTSWWLDSCHDDVIKWKHFLRYGPCAGNSPVTGEFPSQRPVTRTFDVFFDLRLNKRLSKQSRRRWFETPSRSLWRHCNVEGCRLCQVNKTDTYLFRISLMSRYLHIINMYYDRERGHMGKSFVVDTISVTHIADHDNVKIWKRSPHYWSFVKGTTSERWIPSQRANNQAFWCFCCQAGPTDEQAIEMLVIWGATMLMRHHSMSLTLISGHADRHLQTTF